MIVSIIKSKAKDWQEQFKKEFGGLPSDATLGDVVKHKASILGNHVDAFIKERTNDRKTICSSNDSKKVETSNQETSKGEKENGDRSA